MAVIYKCYYKRSIVEELPETWGGDEKKTSTATATADEIAELFAEHENRAIEAEKEKAGNEEVVEDDGESRQEEAFDEESAPATDIE